jgi:hypothetical protein
MAPRRAARFAWLVALCPLVRAATTVGHGLLAVTNEATGDVSLSITGIASQTANFVTVVNSASTAIFSVDVSGNVVSATNSYSSDARYKVNVTTAPYGLEAIGRLAPVEFFWAEGAPSAGDRRKQLGFIAQDVEAVVPEIVSTDENGYKSLMYDRVAVIAARAIQEQQATIGAQQATIAALEARLAAVEAKLATL